MKKFIVEFEYAGFLFTARVDIYMRGTTVIYAVELIQDFMSYVLGNRVLIFTKLWDNTYSLCLFLEPNKVRDGENIPLKWHIRTELVDSNQIRPEKQFSES